MSTDATLKDHVGKAAVVAAGLHGQATMWTLSGAHIFPLYDAAVGGRSGVEAGTTGPMRLIDVRHEATAVFAAEASGKLSRRPGFAAVTAGPGVTNAVSGVASARFNGSPLVVFGGRAPTGSWGKGALQELDHPPIFETITKAAFTVDSPDNAVEAITRAFTIAGSPHRGPVFLDAPMDVLFSHGTSTIPSLEPDIVAPDEDSCAAIAARIATAERPVLVLGGDVWANGAEAAAVDLITELNLPTIANGMGRGVLPAGHPCQVTRARSTAFKEADLVVVIGTPLDFRLGYGAFGGREGSNPAEVIHIADDQDQLASHTALAESVSGDLRTILTLIHNRYGAHTSTDHTIWQQRLRDAADAAIRADEPDLTSEADPIHPARIYGELNQRLTDDTVVIGDGGDFVSFAGKYVTPNRPGNWLDPGPYGCLGTGLGYAMSARVERPSSPVVLLMGDGAAGFSLMDVDTLVRHNLPVVMVVGNNSGWALEKHPMRFLYGYEVVADLAPTRYDDVVAALGGAGETVTDPDGIGPALDRAMESGVPYLVNVMTDPEIAYPRATTGV